MYLCVNIWSEISSKNGVALINSLEESTGYKELTGK